MLCNIYRVCEVNAIRAVLSVPEKTKGIGKHREQVGHRGLVIVLHGFGSAWLLGLGFGGFLVLESWLGKESWNTSETDLFLQAPPPSAAPPAAAAAV